MPVAMPTWVQLVFLLCGVCFVLALKGLASPRTARTGNRIGVTGAVVACAVPFLWAELDLQHMPLILGAITLGAVGGGVGAQRVARLRMPQLVALFNGLGGGAAALVAVVELHHLLGEEAAFDGLQLFGWSVWAASAFAIVVGSVSFAGSIMAFAKLRELLPTRRVTFAGLSFAVGGCLVISLALAVQLVQTPTVWLGVVLGLLGLAVGVLLVLRVGGADLPIMISLLNAGTGLTVAATGYVLDNTVLLIAGALVGASGTCLTLLMGRMRGQASQPTMP